MNKILLLLIAMLPLAATAGSTTQVGETTRQALQMQQSGDNGVETRPMAKAVSERVYERYLNSFTHPIPDRFERGPGFISGN